MIATQLGRASKYLTTYNPSVLERVYRKARRKGYTKMYGWDIWNCYEVSFLNAHGKPEYHILKIVTSCNNPYIWESKSLKLYLFSFNSEHYSKVEEVISTIADDLSKLVKGPVLVSKQVSSYRDGHTIGSMDLDHLDVECDIYKVDTNLLAVSKSYSNTSYSYRSDLLRSNCEITNQPDWARVYLTWVTSKKTIDPYSLLKFIVSFRNHQEFHEPCCERIYQAIYKLIRPKYLLIICQYTRRGGVDINPIRCSQPLPLPEIVRAPQQ